MAKDNTVFVGLDVHKNSITAARIGSNPDESVVDAGTLGTRQYAIDRLCKKLSARGRPRFVYEAGPCGFWLQRCLKGNGFECLVAAPSLIPKKLGERIKTDRRDARNLALALRAGTLSLVYVPTSDEEQFRGVVRARQQSRHDVTAARQRTKSFLLRHDVRYTGKATWSAAHRRWLSEMVLPAPAQQIVFKELVDSINERERRRDRLEQQLDTLAPHWSGYPLANALLAFRGIKKTVAYTVVAETHHLSRFAHPRHLMAWLGLVPGEHSPGPTRRQGPITRCGNRFARTMLTEAAWVYRYPPKVSRIIESRVPTVDPNIRDISWKAQLRLHHVLKKLMRRGKH